ncbi:MAG: ORF6N domain-containing protein [Treponema sp.]|nr:ORF6N domain-containing protein [Treponema sp.]
MKSNTFTEVMKRNLKRFPVDFMFQLTGDEWENLRSHFAISSLKYGGRRYAPS